MITEKLKEKRKQMFNAMEKRMLADMVPEDRLFYFHRSEDRIVLSHAIFWVMAQSFKGKIAKEKFFLLLRQYQEEMLNAYLMDEDYFPDLLHYCNIIYDIMPNIINTLYDFSTDKAARKLAATAIVSAGYAGDMPEDLCNELLNDMDFYYNKVKCRKIEKILIQLNLMVATELEHMC